MSTKDISRALIVWLQIAFVVVAGFMAADIFGFFD